LLQKQHSVRYEIYFKNSLIPDCSSGSNELAQVKRERIRENAYYERYFFDSGHLQHERETPDLKRKYMKSDKPNEKSPS